MAATLASRIAELGAVLRRGGVSVGSGEVLLAVRAAESVGVAVVDDLHAALAATLVRRIEDRPVFEAAFRAVLLASPSADDPGVPVPAPRTRAPTPRRLAAPRRDPAHGEDERGTREAREVLAASDAERLAHRDFEQMSPAEARVARELLRAAARWWCRPQRRWRAATRGEVDPRRTLRALARRAEATPQWRERSPRRARLVLLCDVSGSMHAYARAFLLLAHALAGRDRSVELFAFATRLTRLTPTLRTPDADLALARIGADVKDWDGGTRIGAALATLVREHRASLLGPRTLVVLLSDGLERGDVDELRRATAVLRRCCRRVFWLNPLLRYAGYEPLAQGASALYDELRAVRPAHDPASLASLVRTIEQHASARRGRVPPGAR